MNRRIVAAIAGGSLALGILVGAAGAVAVRQVTNPAVTDLPAHRAAMNGMQEHMAGQLGTEMATHVTEMMAGGMMGSGHMGPRPMDPIPGWGLHRQHHPDAP